jgi:hypothetical protein
VVISYPSVYADPAIGGGLSYVKTVPSNKVFTFNRSIDIATNNPSLSLDWLVDSPTRGTQSDTGAGGEVVGNYSVLNPAAKSGPSLSNGNLDFSSSSGMVLGSVPMLNGKYYWEVQANTNLAIAGLFGVALGTTTLSNNPGGNISSWAFNAANGQVVTNSNSSAYGNTMTTNQVLGIAFDADLGKLYFAINNTWQNGGNPVSQLNPAFSNLTSGPYYATFGGSTSSRTLSVNFGVRPYVYTAPTGFKAVIANPLNDTLTFTNSTFLSSFVSGDLVSEVSGDASGVVNAINTGTNQMTVLYSNGTWTVGSQVQDDSRTVPAPAPTTEPPDSNIYTNIVDLQNSTSALTSLLVAKPPLDPFLQYFARVRYTSTAITTTSSYSPWSGFTTGAL